MNRNFRYFIFGFLGALMFFVALNLLVAHLRSDCGLPGLLGVSGCADDISRAGFPLLVWEQGGFDYRAEFYPSALIANVVVTLGVSIAVGLGCQRLFKK